MKIYRGWKDVPELAGLSRSERRKVVRDCFAKVGFGLREFWFGQLAIFGFSALGGIGGIILQDAFGFPRAIELACLIAGVLVGCLIYGCIYYGAILEKLRPYFRDYLQIHRVYQSDESNADTTPRRLS
jgi:hypothetical protein